MPTKWQFQFLVVRLDDSYECRFAVSNRISIPCGAIRCKKAPCNPICLPISIPCGAIRCCFYLSPCPLFMISIPCGAIRCVCQHIFRRCHCEFQFLVVRLDDRVKSYAQRITIISIPCGAIRCPNTGANPQLFSISIPCGAIRCTPEMLLRDHLARFQFLVVRLDVPENFKKAGLLAISIHDS